MSEPPEAPPLGARIELPRSDSPRVSILIPSAAGSRLLLSCLRSLERHLPRAIPSETIVVLDGAPADAAATILGRTRGVNVITSPVRLGLAGAGNRGRREALGDLLVLLHDDSEAEAGWLEALVEAVDAHPEAGVVGGLVLFPDGSLQSAGRILWRDGSTSSPWAGVAPSPEAFARLRAADYCSSSSLLVRAEVWDAVGGLDERLFPVHNVDADFCLAARGLGWTVLFQPASRTRHHRGSSLPKRFRLFVSKKNNETFAVKWRDSLGDFDPPAPDDPNAVLCALARAESAAVRLSAKTAAERIRPAPPPTERAEPPRRDRLERDLLIRKEYGEELEAAIAQRDEALEALKAELHATREAAENGRAIQGLIWWRLYLRLLPILRWLRRTRAFSRRGSASRTE